MSTPNGGDALRALLCEHAPMAQPRLDLALVTHMPARGLVVIEQLDFANETTHRFVLRADADFDLTAALDRIARVIHAPLN